MAHPKWNAWAASGLCIAMLLSAPVAARAQSTAGRHLREAVSLAQHGDEGRALTQVNAVLAANPTFVPALKIQGELLEDLGRQSEAALSYERALKLSPNDAELLLKVGIYRLV